MLFPVREEHLTKCRYTSAFGYRTHPITKATSMHRGIDIALPQGTPLIALADGVVLYSKTNNNNVNTGYGHYLVIKYDNSYYSLYAHLKTLSKYKPGQRVHKGDIIAISGNTGSSTGPHLHFELHKNKFAFSNQYAINPTTVYPQLIFTIGKPVSVIKKKKEEDELVEFKEQWQEDLFYKSLETLKKKGVLQNTADWITKYKSGKLTTSELGLLALVMADRD